MNRKLPAGCGILLLAARLNLPAAVADLSINKTVSPSSVPLGTPLTYLLTVHNAGPDAATDVVLVDMLPAVVVLVSAQSDSGSCTQSADAITCHFDSIASGATATLRLTVT